MAHKVGMLISGGIDSPVAAYLLARAGFDLVAINMDNRPFTDDNQFEKAPALIRKLCEVTGKDIKLWVAPHGPNQVQFARKADRHMQCILCRRMMWGVAAEVAKAEGCSYIATGESLGQVASQTLPNIQAENESPSLPMLRPLIGFDKLEIEAIAKRIGTYSISTGPGVCCTIVPERPVTNASILRTDGEAAKVDFAGMRARAIEEAYSYDLQSDPAV
jgi:tRNA uracil 4-sulfurtransferase